MKSFEGKVAAITGAGSGMGHTLAIELARLLGSAYQIYVLRFHRKLQGRRTKFAHAAPLLGQATSSISKDIA